MNYNYIQHNNTQNPYDYMSKDWSTDINGFKRMMENAVFDIVHDILRENRNLVGASDKVRILYHKTTHRPIKW